MTIKVKLYFQYPNGVDDELILIADTEKDMTKAIGDELSERGAICTGVETLEFKE